ncbi:hypothetical protein ABBQ32_004830 [Trebouxia sp. C0010 RCD-2024]
MTRVSPRCAVHAGTRACTAGAELLHRNQTSQGRGRTKLRQVESCHMAWRVSLVMVFWVEGVNVPLTAACRLIVLTLAIALPFIAAQQPADPAAVYNVTVSPWVNHVVYAPLSVPLGSQLNFVWSGVHGVYLIPTNQCPAAFPPGPNELHPVSAPASVNNMLSVNLTTPGVFYFACQVGDHCVEDGQKLIVTVTNSTAGTVNDLAVLSTVG